MKSLRTFLTFQLLCLPFVLRSQASPPDPASLSFTAPKYFDADGDNDNDEPKTPPGRYFFNLLDGRSKYGHDFFPEIFLGPELDRESEIQLESLHGEKRGLRTDEVDLDLQYNPFGLLTLEAEIGYDSTRLHNVLSPEADDPHDSAGNTYGLESIDLAAYHPIFQFVSADKSIDYTAVARVDVAIPTRTAESGHLVQVNPYLGHLLRIGDHLSLQAWTGPRFTIGPNQTNRLIYGANLGYRILHEQLPLPFTPYVTPVVELDGERNLSHGARDALFGLAGIQWQFDSLGPAQPRLGLGYEFPLDQGARDQLRWAVFLQLGVEF